MAEYVTRKGATIIVDDCDAGLIAGGGWWVQSTGEHLKYAFSREGTKRIYLHRLITGAQSGQVVDHINGNGLDNRRANLRVCTFGQNMRNRRRAKHSAYKYKGVTKNRGGVWEARIGSASQNASVKRFRIGTFSTAEEAAAAYDIAAVLRYGEFACLNFPHVFPELSARVA